MPIHGLQIAARLRSDRVLAGLEGHPRIRPHEGIGIDGLAAAMCIRTDPAPNCVVRGRWILVVEAIPAGTTLRRPLPGATVAVPEPVEAAFRSAPAARARERALGAVRPPRVAFTDYYVAGRGTGFGYDYQPDDPDPPLELRRSPWLQPCEPVRPAEMCRGLFTTRAVPSGTILTSYSGPLVDTSQRGDAGSEYVVSVVRGLWGIDGYRNPRSGHGMAQFANDYTGSGQSPNVFLERRSLDGAEVEVVLRARRELRPGEEMLLNLQGHHRRTYIDQQPTYERNRVRSLAYGQLCLLDVGGLRVAHVQSGDDKQLRVHWYGPGPVGDLGGRWLPGWVQADGTRVFQQEPPPGARADVVTIMCRDAHIVAHRLVLDVGGRLGPDVRVLAGGAGGADNPGDGAPEEEGDSAPEEEGGDETETDEDVRAYNAIDCADPQLRRQCAGVLPGLHAELDRECTICRHPRAAPTMHCALETDWQPFDAAWRAHADLRTRLVPPGRHMYGHGTSATLDRMWTAINHWARPQPHDVVVDWGMGFGKMLLSTEFYCHHGQQVRKLGIEIDPERYAVGLAMVERFREAGLVHHIETRCHDAAQVTTAEWGQMGATIVIQYDGPTSPYVVEYHQTVMQNLFAAQTVRCVFSTKLDTHLFRAYFGDTEVARRWRHITVPDMSWGNCSYRGHVWVRVD